VEPLAPHEKIYVDSEIAEDEFHGELSCDACHGGNPNDPNWKTAHEGVVKDPSYPDASSSCGQCHEDIAEHYASSLHMGLASFKKVTEKRLGSNPAMQDKLTDARAAHCGGCHSSCGQCHISRPESVEGGLLEAHLFQKRPPMQQVCTACHGSRVANEYFGKNKGIPPDIHKEKYFKCNKCHTAEEMHGDGNQYGNRYEVENSPKCLNCHAEIYSDKSVNASQHKDHKDKLSCQVCHSMPYKNCYTCHVGRDEQGLAYYKTKGSMLSFKIGLNPLQSEKRPEKFVPVRHVPVDPNTFKYYGDIKLANFDALPTWKLATPHNIRRQTPQNKSCNACHGNHQLFLSKNDVKPEYFKANAKVIVPPEMVPQKVDE
jgi:thiosulfate/3-mercaptopyruvate sulfurtransferase